MKRAGNLWPSVVAFESLLAAARRAAKGKRGVAAVARFLADVEPEVLALQRELRTGTWRPGPASSFLIRDPKVRTITAAPFRDRVVHHALMGALEPVLDRRMVAGSFACRRGKGAHAALRYARKLLRRHEWFLKLDVERCFESMAHDVVLATLARSVKDRRVLLLAERIVRAGRGNRGLPIGSLTSQWLANLVLDRMDHFVIEELGVGGYVRYMDDFVLFGASKADLRAHRATFAAFVTEELDLRLKERATIVAPARQGLPFLGWRLHRGVTRLRHANVRRSKRRLRRRVEEYRAGRIDEEALAASVRSVCEHLRQGGTLGLRRRWFEGPGDEPRAPP